MSSPTRGIGRGGVGRGWWVSRPVLASDPRLLWVWTRVASNGDERLLRDLVQLVHCLTHVCNDHSPFDVLGESGGAVTMGALVPEVVGPVQGSNPPWGGPRFDVTSVGYVVEEFYLGGTTIAYDLVAGADYSEDGRWTAVAGPAAPYLTRILVVRPREPAAFNGTVVLNWQNVSAGYEYGSLAPGDEAFEGYAWVGVSAQEVGIYGFSGGRWTRSASGNVRPLRGQDPERYGPLRHPGDRGSFEIFAQAARAVGPARSSDVDPMGGLEVQRVIAAGASQSAMRLVAYANAVHPLAPVVDGFL